MFPLKLSYHEQQAIVFVLWAKKRNANEIHSEMHPAYGNKYFTMQTVHI